MQGLIIIPIFGKRAILLNAKADENWRFLKIDTHDTRKLNSNVYTSFLFTLTRKQI